MCIDWFSFSGQNTPVSLYLKHTASQNSSTPRAELPLEIVGCAPGYELDLIPREEADEIYRTCLATGANDDDGVDGAPSRNVRTDIGLAASASVEATPALLRCVVVTTLSEAQKSGVLSLVRR